MLVFFVKNSNASAIGIFLYNGLTGTVVMTTVPLRKIY